jgi:hypothetical protein
METIITYKERPLARKPDSQCQPMTLLVRKYYQNKKDYYERNKESLKAKARERYKNDDKYKQMCTDRRLKRVERIKKEVAGEKLDK